MGFDQVDILPAPAGKEDELSELVTSVAGIELCNFSAVCFTGAHWDTPVNVQANVAGLHAQWKAAGKFATHVCGPMFRGFGVDVKKPHLSSDQERSLIEPAAQGLAQAIITLPECGIEYLGMEILNPRENHGCNSVASGQKIVLRVRELIEGKSKIHIALLPDIAHINEWMLTRQPELTLEEHLAPLSQDVHEGRIKVVHFSCSFSRGEPKGDPTPFEEYGNFFRERGFDETAAFEVFGLHDSLRGAIPGFGIPTFKMNDIGAVHRRGLERMKAALGWK